MEHYELLEAVVPPGSGTPQQRFVEILGLNPTSTEYHYRYGVNITRTGVYAGREAQEFDIKETHGSIYMHSQFKELMLPESLRLHSTLKMNPIQEVLVLFSSYSLGNIPASVTSLMKAASSKTGS